MEETATRMVDFVDRLWTSPNLGRASIVHKENNILAFLRENQPQIRSVLKRPELFPDRDWEEVLRLFLETLALRVIAALEVRVDAAVDQTLQTDLLAHFQSDGPVSIRRDDLKAMIRSLLPGKILRDQYAAVFDAISGRFFSRYVPGILKTRGAIYNELVRRDRLMKLDPSLLAAYLGLASLFRPLYFFSPANDDRSLSSAATNQGFEQGFSDLMSWLGSKAGQLPERIVRPGLESQLRAYDHPDQSGAARLISIIVSRAADYDPYQKVDKGAESPDKSWFNIHRRNARYYGFDALFLDELYRIASEEGW
ncbi:MAG: hypothetical protein HS115_19790 [Spirochaetales bacterium]|nr:hypothetical protein [Spirochaetales bacterium]